MEKAANVKINAKAKLREGIINLKTLFHKSSTASTSTTAVRPETGIPQKHTNKDDGVFAKVIGMFTDPLHRVLRVGKAMMGGLPVDA